MDQRRASVMLVRIARILMVAFILFLTMFSFDVFSMEGTLLEKLGGFLMHSIPSLVLVAVLLLSWRKPLVTGILALVLAAAYTVFAWSRGYPQWAQLILPLAVAGGLFVAAHFASGQRAPGSLS